MTESLATAWLVLLGTLIGAAAGVAGSLITAVFTNRAERQRLAIEAGFREWEGLRDIAIANKRPAELFPPVLYVHFNNEVIRALESKGGLTGEKYRELLRRRDAIKAVIREASAASRASNEREQ